MKLAAMADKAQDATNWMIYNLKWKI
jgi:hypothetical protein